MQDFHKLNVYQEAKVLAKDIYLALKGIPDYNRIKGQLTGSTTAVCTNLAEMAAYDNKNQQRQKIITCIGETNETEFWLDFCKETGILNAEQHKAFLNKNKVVRMMPLNLKKAVEVELRQTSQSS